MSAGFTPGPWQTDGDYVRDARGEPIPLATAWVEDAWQGIDATDESRANARLIAAAPELYKYLTLALDVLDRANVAWGGEPAARAALARARGES